jgi:SAM-dependent methyltransferase
VTRATPAQPATDRMRRYWDERARENAMYYIHSRLDFAGVDEAQFWASGAENLDQTLAPFGLAIGPADRVLEIGCGIGRMTRAIAARAASVTGVDVSAEMVDRGRRALAGTGNVELVLGNGRDLGVVPDASVDVVYSFIVFQHIPDPQVTCGYIREIGRVLRPGGWTVFQVSQRHEIHRRQSWEAEDGLRGRLRRWTGRAPRTLDPEWLGSAVDPVDLARALEEGGLVLDAAVGEGTQFCLVHAHRPAADGGVPTSVS